MSYVKSGDIQIYLRESIVQNSKIAVLLIHGLAEHSGRYEGFVNDLSIAGISVFAMDLRGHGYTTGKRGDSESILKVLSDVDNLVKFIKANYKFDKFGVFGHSVGGLVTSLYLSLFKANVDFVILSSPCVYCPQKLKIINFLPYNLLSFVKIKKRHSESKEMLEVSHQDKLALHKFSLRTVGVFLHDGIKLLKKKLDLTCPVMLVCGAKDRLLNEQKKFEEFYFALKNPNNKFTRYVDAKHRIVQNEGKEKRIEDIIKWIQEIVNL